VNSILVTATLKPKADWLKQLGEIKAPSNYGADAAKKYIDKRMQELEESGPLEYPQCLTIGDCLVESFGTNPQKVAGASSLLKTVHGSFMSASARNAGCRINVSGFDLRTVLKVAALECLKEETTPMWALVFEHPSARFIDPLYSITLNYSTKLSDEKALELAGIGGVSYATPIELRHAALKTLVTKLMID
jgi:hypothetical protein